MIKAHVDLGKCQGFANCVMTAPDMFDMDSGNKAIALSQEFEDADVDDLEEAAESCPVAAIRLERLTP